MLRSGFPPFSKCIVAPTAAMVDSRCPVRLQMQLIGEEESDELEDTDVARRPRIARIVHMTTEAEVEAHMVRHANYRNWCPDCVAGRGVSHQHRASKNEKLGREFSLDYAFMTAEEVGEDMRPVLIR